ncbi:hypothetical protein FHX64_002137 [Microbacter margulisiae]|uniref:Uncharacterized protein n=1 Tax=Microbacter margulisiae TaxID=1350067 RepID=A0A7W5H2V1_9PORP|nr:hypothetical protein [Microbacter margulisiae]
MPELMGVKITLISHQCQTNYMLCNIKVNNSFRSYGQHKFYIIKRKEPKEKNNSRNLSLIIL